jgi:hypothetical protein
MQSLTELSHNQVPRRSLSQRLQGNKGLLCLWLLALFTWWMRYHPLGLDVVVFDDDARQHVYWTARFADPSLFPDDLITDFMASTLFAPWGYQWLYRLGNALMDPLPFSQIVSLVIVLVSLWLLDRLLICVMDDRPGRFVAGLMFLFYHTHNTFHNILGGVARSFAVPLLLLFLLLLCRGYLRSALATLPLALALYPPIILNTLALAGETVIKRWWHGIPKRALALDVLTLIVTTACIGTLMLATYGVDQDLSGSQVTLEQARHMPEFYPGGRVVFFRAHVLTYMLTGRSGIGIDHLSGFLIIIVVMGVVIGWRNLRIPSLVWGLLWTSLALFALSHATLFRLYLPSRYTFYTFSLAFILAIGANWSCLWQRCSQSQVCGRLVLHLRPLARPLVYAAAVALFLLTYALVQSFIIYKVDPRLVVLDHQDRAMLQFLATLPTQSLIAGHPFDMDNVPLMAHRKVLINAETAFPYYLGYYNRIKDRVLDSLRTYYAAHWSTVVSFVQRYGVDAFVVHKERLHPRVSHEKIFYEPFDTVLKEELKDSKHFVLATPPGELRCFENARYIVLCFAQLPDVPRPVSNTTEITTK